VRVPSVSRRLLPAASALLEVHANYRCWSGRGKDATFCLARLNCSGAAASLPRKVQYRLKNSQKYGTFNHLWKVMRAPRSLNSARSQCLAQIAPSSVRAAGSTCQLPLLVGTRQGCYLLSRAAQLLPAASLPRKIQYRLKNSQKYRTVNHLWKVMRAPRSLNSARSQCLAQIAPSSIRAAGSTCQLPLLVGTRQGCYLLTRAAQLLGSSSILATKGTRKDTEPSITCGKSCGLRVR
jgi:hypothetical protein